MRRVLVLPARAAALIAAGLVALWVPRSIHGGVADSVPHEGLFPPFGGFALAAGLPLALGAAVRRRRGR